MAVQYTVREISTSSIAVGYTYDENLDAFIPPD